MRIALVRRSHCIGMALSAWLFVCGCAGTNEPHAVENIARATATTTTTTLTYKASQLYAQTADCLTSKNILLKEPTAPGHYPVFIYIVGTWGHYDSAYVNAILDGAVSQGFVAASIDYQVSSLARMCEQNGWFITQCMFSTTNNSESALAAICGRSQADCDGAGVVVAGHSQGGAHAAMARNFDTRIRGAWTMGFADRHWDGSPQPCMDEGVTTLGKADKRLLHNDRLRVFRGGNEGIDIAWSNQTTGMSCAGTTTCLNGANSSGWYYPSNNEVTFTLNPNKHCFFQSNPLDLFGNKVDCADTIDPKFTAVPPATTYPAGLHANLSWLKETILPLGNQP
jgi:hypothetical protein